MTELTSTLKVVVDASGAQSGADRVKQAVSSMASTSNTQINSMNKSMSTFSGILNTLNRKAFGFIQTIFSSIAIVTFTKSLVLANREYAAFMAISKVTQGSLAAAGDSWNYVRDVSNTLGISLEANIKTFGKFAAAMKPMDKEGTLTKHLFEGIAVAASGLHMSAQAVEYSFLALQQAASKNKPTLEEFQRQLAEHIPGAMAYLAEGVGLRMDQIHAAISNGTIGIKDLLTGLANVLKEKFGAAAEYAAEQLPASINLLKNAYFEFLVTIGNEGAASGIQSITKALTELLNKSDVTKTLSSAFKDVGDSIAAFIRSITAEDIQNVASAFKGITAIITAFVKNVGTIFTVLFSGIIAGNIIKFVGFVTTISSKARLAATGVSVLRVAFTALGATLTGPLGIIVLLASVIGLLTTLDNRKAKPIGLGVGVDGRIKDLKAGSMSSDPAKQIASNAAEISKYSAIIDENNKRSVMSRNDTTGSAAYLVKLRDENILLAKQIKGASAQSEIDKLLGKLPLPGDKPIGATSTSKSKGPVDPQKAFMDDLLDEAKTLGMGEEALKRYDIAKMKLSPTNMILADALTTEIFAFKAQQEAVKLLNEEFDLMDSKENDRIKTMQDASGALGLLVKQQEFEVYIMSLSNIAREEAIRTREAEIAGIDVMSRDYLKLNARLNATYQAQNAFGQSTSIINSAEQSLQSRVISGLISETEARTTLRDVIGAQGAALQNELLPQLQAIMVTTTDQSKLAEMQQMIDKIREMVAIGNQKGVFAGFEQGVKDFANSAADSFQTVRDATANAFKGMEDALVEFAMTGKLNFKDLAGSIIKDMIRIQIQQSLTPILSGLGKAAVGIIGGLIGGATTGAVSQSSYLSGNSYAAAVADGGVFSGGGLTAFAKGGILGPMGGMLTKPTVFPMANGMGLAGEAGPEAVMPLKRGSDGKLGVASSGGGGGGAVAVSITINDNRTQTETTGKGDDRSQAPKIAEMIKGVVHAKLVQEMRPGGLLA